MIWLYDGRLLTQNNFILVDKNKRSDLKYIIKNFDTRMPLTSQIILNILHEEDNEDINLSNLFGRRKDIDYLCDVILGISSENDYRKLMEIYYPDFYAFTRIYEECIRLSSITSFDINTAQCLPNNISISYDSNQIDLIMDKIPIARSNQKILNLTTQIHQNKK